MKSEKLRKYQPFHQKFDFALPGRTWPDRVIERAPTWASVDLRDGNQALAVPMSVEEKMEFFRLLVDIGFKEIEVGFPSASETEYRFLRRLIEENAIPDDVRVQVLVQAREHLIRKTFVALQGAKRAVVHMYNSTSPLQRLVTFNNASREDIKKIAVDGTKLVKELAVEARNAGTEIVYQYSPESFSDTELDYAYNVCMGVYDEWKPVPGQPMILNLPATVEWTTPNVHADMIEWFCQQLEKDGRRETVRVSLHTHNDRGTGVAATELALLAGADRVEGTLFGNGERTGNLDIVTVALNLNSHGIETGLEFDDLPAIKQVYERVTRLRVPERQPYAGELVFTAFSGSHQDAIKKGMDRRRRICAQYNEPEHDKETCEEIALKFPESDEHAGELYDELDNRPVNLDDISWEVPYLTIDPEDIGRSYEAIIRINSQSGKGGVAYVLDREWGLDLPKSMHPEVGAIIGEVADREGKELLPPQINEIFRREYLELATPLALVDFREENNVPEKGKVTINADVLYEELPATIQGIGNGPINAFVHAMEDAGWKDFRLTDYRSHAIGGGSATDSASYIQLRGESDGKHVWGCGIDPSIEKAGLLAVVSAFNRLRALS